jgi:hypothetical protein
MKASRLSGLSYLRNGFPICDLPSLDHEVLEVLPLPIMYVLSGFPYRVALKAHIQGAGKVTNGYFPYIVLLAIRAHDHDTTLHYGTGNTVMTFVVPSLTMIRMLVSPPAPTTLPIGMSKTRLPFA